MKEYNYLQAIYMSFYSPKLYRDVCNNWGGGAVLYLFLLLAICWAAMMFKYQPSINIAATQFSDKFVMQMPELVIKDGKITTPLNQPYEIKDPDSGALFAVIDTSGKYTSLDNAPKDTKVLVTKDAIYYYDNDTNNIRVQKAPQNVSWDLKPDQVKAAVVKFAGWLWVLLLPLFLFLSLIYRLIQAVIYAAIGMIFAAIGKVDITYGKVLKLALIAITPAIIIGTILDWLNVEFHYEWLLFLVLGLGYLAFAILASKNDGTVNK